MFTDSLGPILQWINQHPSLSGLFTFIISTAESIAVIGTIVPGTVMMTAIGVLAGSGVIPLGWTIFWAIMGAIVGDGISYWLGYALKDRIRTLWPINKYPNALAKAENFVYKHGGKSVFIGRFVGPVRALVPLVAGMLGMKPLHFTIANVLSAIGWAPIYMLPGILVGAASLELPTGIAIHAIIIICVIAALATAAFLLIRKLLLLLSNPIERMLQKLWLVLSQTPYTVGITRLLKHYQPEKSHKQLVSALFLLLTLIGFILLSDYLYHYQAQSLSINQVCFHLFRELRNNQYGLLENIFVGLTLLGEKNAILTIAVTMTLWLLWRRNFYTAVHWLLLCLLATGSIGLIKTLVQSVRPWGLLNSSHDYSYPSGHTTLVTTIYFGLCFLFIQAIPTQYRRTRESIVWCVAIVTVLVSVSRLYLGAHWFTDVLGAWLLSIIILMFISISYHRKQGKPVQLFGILLVTFFTLGIAYNYYYQAHFQQMKISYIQQDWPVRIIDLDDWWNQNGNGIHNFRSSRLGLRTDFLNLQWTGELNSIAVTLRNQGWKVPPPRNWVSILYRIADVENSEYLPLLFPRHLDKPPVLTLVKHAIQQSPRLLVLRLWDSNITFNPHGQRLWVGNISLVPRTYSWLYRKNKTNTITLSTDLIFNQPSNQWQYRMIDLSPALQNKLPPNERNKPIMLIKPK